MKNLNRILSELICKPGITGVVAAFGATLLLAGTT